MKKYESGGLIYLINEIWRYLFDTLENNSPKLFQKLIVIVYWLPYGKILRSDGQFYALDNLSKKYRVYFPQLHDHRRFRETSINRLKNIYYYDDFVYVEPGDVVVDIGAYIGITSIAISGVAAHVYAIEPSPRSFKCLEKNVNSYNNIDAFQYAILDETTEIELQYGSDPSDDSVIEPDNARKGASTSVSAKTIEDLMAELNLEKIDFLKVEAEGVEPEIVNGIKDSNIRKIAVNCDPERDGKTPLDSVSRRLIELGYDVIEGEDPYYTILYAKDTNQI